jgi:hypothetical protein
MSIVRRIDASPAREPSHAGMAGRLPVTVCEDARGRLVLVLGDGPCEDLFRFGRTAIDARHLAPATCDNLLARGQATVDGPDAVNALLALSAARAHPPRQT